MKIRAAVLWKTPGKWEVGDVELDGPKENEVLVKLVASGLCHSDDHFANGDVGVQKLPFVGGHEGAGIVEEVGPGVLHLQAGDHVVTSFIPPCGRCRWCTRGRQNLCTNGALMTAGCQLDGTFRMHVDGQDVAQGGLISTFVERSVMPAVSCVKIDPDIPLEVACLVGCGVPTGWGSAANAASVRAGDIVIVMGTGGVGMNAVQGARHSGATRVLAVDPVAFKRELALKLGATDAFADISEAAELARELTGGQGADVAIVTVGVVTSEDVGAAFSAIGKGGTVVVTAAGSQKTTGIPVNLLELTLYQKRIQGALYGMGSPGYEIPLMIDLYKSGDLKLDELVTTTYRLEQINDAYDDMHAGKNIRGVIVFPD